MYERSLQALQVTVSELLQPLKPKISLKDQPQLKLWSFVCDRFNRIKCRTRYIDCGFIFVLHGGLETLEKTQPC